MIYNQDFFYYFFSIALTILLGLRLTAYLQNFFEQKYSLMIAITILLHPLSIDSFLAPNTLPGTLAFYFFIESLNFENRNKNIYSICLCFLATILNFSYCLFPLFFFWKKRKVLKIHITTAIFYTALLSIYLFKHLLSTPHNPLTFFSYFILNGIAPLNLSVINYSLYPFSVLITISSLIVVVLLIIGAHLKKNLLRNIWPYIFLPLIGNSFHQWAEPYKFWHEVLLTSSNFFCITFALVVLVAVNLPRKAFLLYSSVLLYFSITWAILWFPYSTVLKESILTQPDSSQENFIERRVLAWELLYEGKIDEGKALLKILYKDTNNGDLLKQDLDVLSKMKAK